MVYTRIKFFPYGLKNLNNTYACVGYRQAPAQIFAREPWCSESKFHLSALKLKLH